MSQTLLQYKIAKDISQRFQVHKGTMREILGISESTQARYERKNAVLKPAIADRLERFQRITQQALELFEDETETLPWLSSPQGRTQWANSPRGFSDRCGVKKGRGVTLPC